VGHLHLAVVGLIGFDLAFATERRKATGTHALADAMRHEPRGFVREVEHPMKLMRRDAFL
jgi:hypothetical protein